MDQVKLENYEVKGKRLSQWKVTHVVLAVYMMKSRYCVPKELDKQHRNGLHQLNVLSMS